MSALRRFLLRCLNLLHSKGAETDLAREVNAHLTLLEDEFRRRGATPVEARFAARRAFGGIELTKERHRDARSFAWLDDLRSDLRYAVRTLRRSPGFTAVAAFTLAVGIGANVAIFSAVNTVLLTPLPYNHPEQLVNIGEVDLRTHRGNFVSSENFVAWRDRVSSFQEAAGWRFEYFNVIGRDEPEQVQGYRVSGPFLHLMSASSQVGRILEAGDDQPGHEHVVVISDALWRRRFGAAPDIVGTQIQIEGELYTVVGVLSQAFRFLAILNRPIDLYVPLTIDAGGSVDRENHRMDLNVYCRLKPGVSLAQAQSEMDAFYRSLDRTSPLTNDKLGVILISQAEASTRGSRAALLLLMAAAGMVLLIACANIANLLLARAGVRQREMAVRAALGASRGRLIRQLLTESILLALLGGIAGTLAAVWGVRALDLVMPVNRVSRTANVIDSRVFVFSLALSMICGLVFGLAPAWHSIRQTLRERLSAGRGTALDAGRHGAGRLFVVAQLTLAVMLSCGALLLVRSALILMGMPRGLDLHNVLTMQIWLPRARYPDRQHASRFFHEILERVKKVPGVESASIINFLPLSAQDTGVALRVEGTTVNSAGDQLRARYSVIDPQYFRTMRIPLLVGRAFLESDADEARGVAIVSASMAHRLWPNGDAIGRQIQPQFTGPQNFWDAYFQNLPLTIVGVVGDVRDDANPDREGVPLFYLPYQQNPALLMHLVIRTRSLPLDLATAVRREVWAVDKEQPVFDTKTMEDVVAETFGQPLAVASLSGMFASGALLLAGLGVYGLLSYVVSRRTRDIGIRMALGAQHQDVLQMILREGAYVGLAGIAVGFAASLGMTGLLGGFLFGVGPADPLTFASVALLMLSVTLAACYVPARRATKVDPLVALRCE